MKNKHNLLALVSLILALPGALLAFSQEKDGIKIQVKDFMNNPYTQVINNTKWTLTAEDLQKHNIAAIKIKVTNNTDKSICISGRSIKLLQVTSEDVAAKFKKREILPPFLLSCVNGIIGVGYWCRMACQEYCNWSAHDDIVKKKWKAHQKEADFLQDDCYAPLFDKYNLDKDTIDLNNPVFKTSEFKEDLRKHLQDNMDPQCKQDISDTFKIFFDNVFDRWAKIIVFFTCTGFGSAFTYWLYLKDLNNQLVIALKQSLLEDELITIAPKESVEKIILFKGIVNQNFNFSIFNRGQVPVAEFAVDLNA